MSTAKALATVGTVGGGALGGAALGGAFSGDSTSKVATNEETDKSDQVPTPKTSSTNKLPKPSENDTLNEKAGSKSPQKPEELPITYSFLNEHNPSTSDYSAESVANKYKHLIVHVYGLQDKSNNKWWEKSYTKYTQDSKSDTAKTNLSGDFDTATVTSAFSSSSEAENTKALNKVCDAFYKKKIADTLEGENDKDQKAKNKINFWKYCSPLGKAPITVEEKGNSEKLYTVNNAIGKTNKKDLISVEAGDNDVLWEIKNERFFALKSVTSTFFNTLKTQTSQKTNKNALRDKCKEAYEKVDEKSEEATKVSIESVKKFCTVDLIK